MRPSTPESSVQLPPRFPTQRYRRAQSNIPDERAERERLKRLAEEYMAELAVVPPVPMKELREHAKLLRARAGIDAIFDDYLAILVNNAMWRDTLAHIPFERRLLLMPKCLRVEDRCPAPFDEFGLLCKDCGLCSIQDFAAEAERLGYAVLVAEGSAIVTKMIETGRIEAIVGVSCLNVLEKCFPHMESAAVPGLAVPLLQDDCANTTVDLEWVWDLIHLTSEDKTWRLDLDALKSEVQSWFALDSLAEIMGPARGRTEEIAREWLARAGNRWRPWLTACVVRAYEGHSQEELPPASADLKKLAVAVECFHKASLVHDDIEDGDAVRYGEATLHAEHGVPVALNVGDFLLGEGYRLIGELDLEPKTLVAMLRKAADGHLTLSRGQGAELCWTREPKVLTSLEVLEIFRQKTAPAFEVALTLGAHFAGADEETHAVLREYSESIGIAYQIKDDLEDFTGESDSNDLEDLRPSLLLAIAHARSEEGPERDLLTSLWRRQRSFGEVEHAVRSLLEERGVVQKARDLGNAYEEQAIRALRVLQNATLKGLMRRVVGKIFPRELIQGYCGEFEARNAPGGEARTASAGGSDR